MLKKNKGLMILTSVIILLPVLAGILLWDRLPEQMATHWGGNGEADGWSSRPVAVFGLPLFLLAIHWMGVWLTGQDRRNRNQNEKILQMMFWIAPVISLFGMGSTYAAALGQSLRIDRLALLLLGIVFTIIGNYLPKCRQNDTIGIKIIWTLSDEENWNATHRLAGKVWVIGGILMALGGFLPNGWAVVVMLALIFPMCIIPIVYSWRFYEKEKMQGKDIKAGYSAIDKKIMKGFGIFLILITIFVLIVLFYGDIHYVFNEDYLFVDTNMYTDYILRYDTIENIEYREGPVPGLRVGGFGSFRLLMGFFENEEFGTYTRYTYYDPEACVVAMVRGKAVVLSGKTAAETRDIYETLLAIIN